MKQMTKPVKLKPYIKQVRGIAFNPQEISDIPFEGSVAVLKANNITEDGLDDTSLIFIDAKKVKDEQLIRAGDILLAASSGSKKVIGKNIFFPEGYDGSFGAFCKLVRTKAGLQPEYLRHFFKTTYYRNSIEKAVQGANINNLKNEHLDDLEILLPLFDNQKRIANLLGKVEGLIACRKQHLRQLDDLLRSVFFEIFGDPISNPKKFPVRNLSEFYINPKKGTKCGPFGSALKKQELVDSGIPVWNMDNIDPAGRMVLPFRMWITEEKFKELASYLVIDGDIIISRAGTVGKMCVARMNGEPAIISTNLIRLRLGNKLRPLHVVSLMAYCKGRVGRLKTGADGAFTHMNTGILDKLEFPYPPIELQDNFTAIVEKVEGIKSSYEQSLTDLESLYGALSQKAFKGELDLSRIPVDIGKYDKQDRAEGVPMDELLSESMEATLSELNAFNENAISLKALQDAIRLSKVEIPQMDSIKRVAEQLAALRSPVDELKRMSSIANVMEQLSPNLSAIKAFSFEHSESVQKSVELARKLSFDIPKVDVGWIEYNSAIMKSITEPFESMRKTMEQINMSSSLSLRLPSEIAKQLQSNIPDFTSWLKQSANPEAFDIDDEEEVFKRSFTRGDVAAVFAKTAEPISFDDLLLQLSDLETVNFAGYETIKDILFELLAEQKLTQFFDKEHKTLLLKAAP